MPRDNTEPVVGQVWKDTDPRGHGAKIVLLSKTEKKDRPAVNVRSYVFPGPSPHIFGTRRVMTIKNLQRWYSFTGTTVAVHPEDM
jgi:hypothetical protein